jgi:flavin-dependent dehydrogenase
MTIIVGGGGAGLYYARLLKEKHPEKKVIVLEEHVNTGKPVQCTGILTSDIYKLLPAQDIEKFTLNKITKTEVFSPNNSTTTKISQDNIICNVSFIEYLEQKAKDAGVQIINGARYLENQGPLIKYRDIETKEIKELKDHQLVGADGPSSEIAKHNNLYDKKRQFLTGVQARVKIKDLNEFDKEKIKFYPYIGEYAWFTPESDEIARIGVAARKNAKQIFDSFIKKFPGEILEMQGGPIPLHKPRTKVIRKQNQFSVALLGDAALQIKNTTGGGIIPGMTAAVALSQGFDKYNRRLGKLNRELYLHYLLNKMFRHYTDKDWDRLINKTKNPEIQKILENTNRDNALKLLLKLSSKPSLLAEGARAIPKLFEREERAAKNIEEE